jgi:hypothetical protein
MGGKIKKKRNYKFFLFFLILKNLNTQCFVLDWICERGSCSFEHFSSGFSEDFHMNLELM